MEKVNVDKSLCISCGMCVANAPETFDFDSEGKSEVINDTVTDNAKMAQENCPTDAIKIEEAE